MLIVIRVTKPLAPLGSLCFGYKNLSSLCKLTEGCNIFLLKEEEK